MSTVWRFLMKFASLICSPLDCFDRAIFKGRLPIQWVEELERFADFELKMRRFVGPAAILAAGGAPSPSSISHM